MVVLSPVRQVIFLFLNVRILFIKQLLGWRFWGGVDGREKKKNQLLMAHAWWRKPIFLVSWETRTGRVAVRGHPGKNSDLVLGLP